MTELSKSQFHPDESINFVINAGHLLTLRFSDEGLCEIHSLDGKGSVILSKREQILVLDGLCRVYGLDSPVEEHMQTTDLTQEEVDELG